MPSGIYIRSEQAKINIGKAKLGSIPWNKGKKTGHTPWNKGKKHSEETKRKVSETKLKQKRKMTDKEKKYLSEYNKRIGKVPPCYSGEKNGNWHGGKSYEPYSVDWTKTLKRSIRERDNYTCQLCVEKQGDETFSVHHIDYNKKNCNPDNLVSLCRSCHGRTGKNRKYWIDYFKNVWAMKLQLRRRSY